MKIFRHFLCLLLCLLLFFSCIGSGPSTESGKNPKSDAPVLQEDAKPVTGSPEAIIGIAGFGSARTVNQKMAETWAQQNAVSSLYQQASGFNFTYNIGSRELQLENSAEGAFSGERRLTGTEVYQAGEHWEAIAIYHMEIPVKIPEGAATANISTRITIQNLAAFTLETVKAALVELVGINNLNDAETLSGNIHLQEVTIVPETNHEQYNVETTYFISY